MLSSASRRRLGEQSSSALSRAWMEVIPTSAANTIPDTVIQFGLRRILLREFLHSPPPPPSATASSSAASATTPRRLIDSHSHSGSRRQGTKSTTTARCPHCGQMEATDGRHFERCTPRLNGLRTLRHNHIRVAVAAALARDKALIVDQEVVDGDHRHDIVVQGSQAADRWIIDIGVCSIKTRWYGAPGEDGRPKAGPVMDFTPDIDDQDIAVRRRVAEGEDLPLPAPSPADAKAKGLELEKEAKRRQSRKAQGGRREDIAAGDDPDQAADIDEDCVPVHPAVWEARGFRQLVADRATGDAIKEMTATKSSTFAASFKPDTASPATMTPCVITAGGAMGPDAIKVFKAAIKAGARTNQVNSLVATSTALRRSRWLHQRTSTLLLRFGSSMARTWGLPPNRQEGAGLIVGTGRDQGR